MKTLDVTVVSCVYGDYRRFTSQWDHAISQLDPRPMEVIVASDRALTLDHAHVFIPTEYMRPEYMHPQAFYLDQAIRWALTEWVWICDIDDVAFPYALAGLDEVQADVWQMGFHRSDGERYTPPQLSNAEYLASEKNVYVGGSAFKKQAYLDCGGFPDVALQDWALWRRLARAGATFQTSGRAHYHYNRHDATRGATELTMDVRAAHLAEMHATEEVAVA